MPAIEIGRLCYLTRGRNAGKKAVIIEIENESTVKVLRNGKKQKCNIRHLFPTREIISGKELKERMKEKQAKKKQGKES